MSKTQSATERSGVVSEMFPDGFEEYWHYARYLTKQQRDALFDCLPTQERQFIRKTYHRGGWEDLIMHETLNEFRQQVIDTYSYDLLDIRCKVLKNKSAYMPRTVWEEIQKEMDIVPKQHRHYLMGGIKGVVCKKNEDVILIVRSDSKTED